jgi:DNA-binding transcriptional MerR regulator
VSSSPANSPLGPEAVQIPNKLYFRIGDVVRLTGVKAYVLRYWETEFPVLSPKKSGTNQRLYRRKDVEAVLEIKHLLYGKRYTIEGARAYLQARRENPKPVAAEPAQTALFGADPAGIDRIRKELKEILAVLGG